MKKTIYDGVKEILATKNFGAIGVMVKSESVSADDRGKKIVKAGTIIGGDANPVLTNDNEKVVSKNTALLATGAEGVLLYDVDVTDKDGIGAMIIRGEVDLNKIDEAPVAEVVEKLNSRILFIK